MVDLVYPLGSGSRHQDAELKFSLLSARRYLRNLGTIFVIGSHPRFEASTVSFVHIPAEDPTQDSQQNTRAKLKAICRDDRVSEKFLLLNDDFFLLREFEAENFPYYTDGSLAEQIKKRSVGPDGVYLSSMRATDRLLQSRGQTTFNFELHCPFLYERSKLGTLLDTLDVPECGYLLRSLYGNTFEVERTLHEDCKLHPYLNFNQITGWTAALDFFSTSERSMNPDMEKFLAWRFSE